MTVPSLCGRPDFCPFDDTSCQRTPFRSSINPRSVDAVNASHQRLCSSPEWADHLQNDILPRLMADLELGDEMLELGPGAGAATDWLCRRVRRLTAVEMDPTAADSLAARYPDGNVSVVLGDCVDAGLPPESFDSIGSFTMLHHIPTAARQFAVLAEALRLLHPGGVLVGSDSLASNDLHDFHLGDIYNPLDPARLLIQLQTLGFAPISIRVGDELTFSAHKP